MKQVLETLLVGAVALLSAPLATGARTAGAWTTDRTITQVVKLLQSLLEKSKAEAITERELYAKYKCYCDDEEAAKKVDIATLTRDILLLQSDIDRLQASTAMLSKEGGGLLAAMEDNQQSRNEAAAIRASRRQEFLLMETDLSEANRTAHEAIELLASIGADQTLGQAAADHTQFMAGFTPTQLVSLHSNVKQALVAASAFIKPQKAKALEAFLQAPFTGTYTTQAAEVIGILKDMRDTFLSNLNTTRATEAAEQEAHDKYMTAMQAAYEEMSASSDAKQGQLSANDDALAAQRTKLSTAESTLAEAETFLTDLQSMFTEKTKEYQKRTLFRTNEQAALTEAISILNSDAAFETFGSVTATRSGPTSFLQQASVRAHSQGPVDHDSPRLRARAILLRVAKGHSARLSKVAALLEAEDPFATVLVEIEKILQLIQDEDQADMQQLAWCTSERNSNQATLATKEAQITTLGNEISTLDLVIEDPDTGLKKQIQDDEDRLRVNGESQKAQTELRTSENVAYHKNVENVGEAQVLLAKAISVLKAYYSKLLEGGGALIAVSKDQKQPTPPATWTGPYTGQSEHGGTDAISMLEYILSNTKKEETDAHSAEETAQHAFEDSMKQLTDEETVLKQSLASLKLSLAEKEKTLLGKQQDLEKMQAEKATLEAYLLQIKPGCDFIIDNINARKAKRQEEEAALVTAREMLKGTPVYQEYLASTHNETLGDCLGICAGAETHVNCKACLAHVSVPGYCAAYPGTLGC